MSDQLTPHEKTFYCQDSSKFSEMKGTKLLLADDDKIMLDSLRSLIELEFELVGIVDDGWALIFAVQQLHPDAIVVDISIPLLDGIEAVGQIKKLDHHIKVVFLTRYTNVAYAIRAFEVGASGYVLKHAADSELITAIHEAIEGRTYMTPMIAGELVQSYRERSCQQPENNQELTHRQRKILQLLVEGSSAEEVANLLNISRRTVKFHKYTLMSKLKLKTNCGLVRYAIKRGIAAI
jgi:DNA-binding NarL/FixJ family response regulator